MLNGTLDRKDIDRAACAATPACTPTSLVSSVLIGMPHLSAHGLSENWLLKELGHRHWLMLAASAGKSMPAFHDAKSLAITTP